MIRYTVHCIVFVSLTFGVASVIVPTSNDYTHSLELVKDEKYHVFWKYDNTTITFEIHAKTLGWVGFGLSSNGGMAGSDVIIAWIKDGQEFFSKVECKVECTQVEWCHIQWQVSLLDSSLWRIKGIHGEIIKWWIFQPKVDENEEIFGFSCPKNKDRHALGVYEPLVDESQDWTLISAQESGEYTILQVFRKHVTGDADDLCITDSTMRLIYSFNPYDPSGGTAPLQKHTVKGSKSVHLLSPTRDEPTLPDDAFSMDLVMSNGFVRWDTDTTYWCKVFKLPPLEKKHHVVMIEPVIEEGHEWLVHHIVVYACYDQMNASIIEEAHGTNGHCFMDDDEDDDDEESNEKDYVERPMDKCETTIAAWAIGGGNFWYPDHVGFPLGEGNLPSLLKLEVHYDNPDLQKNVSDHSGLTLWLTPTLRQYDAGVVSVGTAVSNFLIVPPGSDGYLTQGMCHGQCLAEAINAVNEEDIKIIAYMLHSHTAGYGMRVRHVRDGVELPPIGVDNSYDFNFQEFRTPVQEIVVKPGDHLITECAYRTEDRDKVIFGGRGTKDEMCLAFILFYPYIPLHTCQTLPTYPQLSNFIAYDEELKTRCYMFPDDPHQICYRYVYDPPERAGNGVLDVVRWIEWTELRRDRMQRISTQGYTDHICLSINGIDFSTDDLFQRFPKITEPYIDDSIYTACPSAFENLNFDVDKEKIDPAVPVNLTYPEDPVDPLSNDYTHSLELLDKARFHIFWKYDDTTITFEIHAKTLGWVGFGLSPNGGMAGSDVIIAWVKNGESHFTDRHATGEFEPLVDESQDWTLISSQESGEFTILQVSRKHVTGDSDDMCITSGTMRLIFSFNLDDPSGNVIQKHTEKGSKSVQLLSPPRDEPKLPDDAFHHDFLMSEGHVYSHDDTTYWCQAFRSPTLDKKHHIVMIEPIIEEGHEWLVHHIVLSACEKKYDPETVDEAVGYHGHCYMYERGHTMDDCITVMYAWAVGGGRFWFPEHIGYPMGEDGIPSLLKLEMHYDNPELKADIIDHSGLRIWMTPTLRQYDAGGLDTGAGASPMIVVPPKSLDFLVRGFCHSECITKALEENDMSEIKIIGVLLHSHLAGRAVRVRHIRNGVELPPILVDDSYDFNFQETRLLPQEVVVKAGDHLVTECIYDTVERENVTLGGFGTDDEMCQGIMMYYPKIPVSVCMSQPTYHQLAKFIESDNELDTECYFLPEDSTKTCYPIVTRPVERAGNSAIDVMHWIEWTEERKNRMQKIMSEGDHDILCNALGSYSQNLPKADVPAITEVYQDKSVYSSCPSAFDKWNPIDKEPSSKGSLMTASVILLTVILAIV